MTRVLAPLLLCALGAVPALADFGAGFLEPVPPRVDAEAVRLGFGVAELAPAGSAVESAAVPAARAGELRLADLSSLRFLLWRAAARGASGAWFSLPPGDPVSYPEEWQVMTRLALELRAMRPILDDGTAAPAPFAVPPGVLARSWTRGGRRYVLLVNDSGADAPLTPNALAPWRSLFAVRADARQLLNPCGHDLCLPREGVLWLEGRLFPGR